MLARPTGGPGQASRTPWPTARAAPAFPARGRWSKTVRPAAERRKQAAMSRGLFSQRKTPADGLAIRPPAQRR